MNASVVGIRLLGTLPEIHDVSTAQPLFWLRFIFIYASNQSCVPFAVAELSVGSCSPAIHHHARSAPAKFDLHVAFVSRFHEFHGVHHV